MPDTATAAAPAQKDAPSPAHPNLAPEAPAPELIPETAQELLRELQPGLGGVSASAGTGSGGNGAGNGTGPRRSAWREHGARRSRDLVALQRLAGNRAVGGIVVQRKPKAVVEETKLEDIKINEPEPEEKPRPFALQYESDSLDQAAKDLSKDITVEGDAIIIGIQPKLVIVYGKQGNRLTPRLELKLPEGVRPAPGVYLAPPASDAIKHKVTFPIRQVMVDPTTKNWVLGGYVAYLKEKEDKKKAKGAPPAAGTQPPAGEGKGAPDPGEKAATPAGGKAGPAGGTDAAPAQPKPLPMIDLRKHVSDGAKLDSVIDAHKDATQFYLVPHPKPGSGGKKGGGTTTGFAGEIEGKGPPPNRPPWPVSMDGPRLQPAGSDGAFSARINWAANGNDTLSSQVISAVGTHIHYRWEVFDITQFAKQHQAKVAAQARQTQALLKAADEHGVATDTEAGAAGDLVRAVAVGGGTPATGTTGSPGSTGGGTTAATVTPPATASAEGKPDEKSFDEVVAEKTSSARGSGTDPTAATRNAKFRRSFEELWDDTARAGKDLVKPQGSTWAERQSNAQANALAIELLPVSFVITSLGASLRWVADLFAGQQDNQEINFPREGTFLVRVITTPSVGSDRAGNPIIRPSSVASRVIEVVKMERMVKEALDEPAAQLAKAELDLANAEKSKDPERIAAAKEARDLKALEVEGDPLKYLDLKIEIKKRELERVKKKYEGIAVGPILEVEREIDLLLNRKKVFLLQEGRRTAGVETVVPAQRVTAALVSEVTGQTYPLMLSVGPAKREGNRHVWKLLDATSEDSEGFTGYGDTPSAAIRDAFRQFGGKAQFGRGKIGVRLPASIQLEEGAQRDFRVDSLPTGWAVARARLDDLVMTLAALGLLVASAGTASVAIGAAVAAARLIERYYNGTLRLDAGAVTDVLAVLGAAGAAAQGVQQLRVAAAGVRFQKVGGSMVMLEEGAAVTANEVRAAEAAFAKGASFLSKIEMANDALNYAGIVWGNVTWFNDMLEIAALEAKGPENGGITHAEARRRRASGLAGAINNNGMAIAPGLLKARQARKAAKKTGTESESKGPSGEGEAPTTKPVEGDAGATKPAGEGTPTGEGQPGPVGPKPVGGTETGGPRPTAAGEGQPGPVGTKPGPKPTEPAAPKPGSSQERALAHRTLQDAARGKGDVKAAAEAAIGKGGSWKEGLKQALGGLEGDHRVAAEKALVEARDRIVTEEWAKLQERYPDLRLENAGTRSFGSDIDATVRPKQEAQRSGPEMAKQVEQAAKAAQELSDALRQRVGGETDAVIDTNIYSFIGEGRLKPSDPAAKAAQQHVDVVVGLAEQMRGQTDAQFKAFEKRLTEKAADPRVVAEAGRVLGQAREFHDARQAEWKQALSAAGAKTEAQATPAQQRAARDAILAAKKAELAGLLAHETPSFDAVARKQSEINWFAPDAYATPSAFKQAVAHGQRLKGSARTAAEWKAPEIAAKLRDAAKRLPPDHPRAQKLQLEANRVESQQRLLDMTLRELQGAQGNEAGPPDPARIKDLENRAKGLRDEIAKAAERIVIGEILGETAPTDKPGPERLAEAAAASGANIGMLESHVKGAKDLDGKVKAAAKYAGRIAMAEFLGGLRTSPDPVARLIGEFVKGRWGVFENAAPQLMRDMFVRYARLTGRHTELAYNSRGEAVGATDALKKAFVEDVSRWARATNDDIQAAAMGAKAIDNPTPATPAPPSPDAAPKPAEGTPKPAPDAPTPAAPREISGAGGITRFKETPALNPPGLHQPFEFRLRSLAEGEATLRRIANGDTTALAERGVQLPQGYKTQGREFGLAQLPDGTFAIVQGDYGSVRWTDLPPGSIPLAHSHPITPERALSRPGTINEMMRNIGRSEVDGFEALAHDAAHVFPSADDVLFCAANGVANHDVHSPYVHTGDGLLRNPTGAPGELQVSFNLSEARHIGNFGGAPVAEAAFVAHDQKGNVLAIGRIWAVDIGGVKRISFEPVRPTDPPDPGTLRPMRVTPAGEPKAGDAGGAKAGERQAGATAEPPTVPGGFTIEDDGYAITVRARRDPTALVRIEPEGQTFKLTDIFRRNLPPGTGSVLLAEGLKKVKAGPGSELIIHGIVNEPTVAAHKAGGNPAETPLGKSALRGLELIGLVPRAMHWEVIRGKLCIVVDL